MPTVTEKYEYALQGPNEIILNYEGNIPDTTFCDRRAEEHWCEDRGDISHLHNVVAERLLRMGINDLNFEVVRRRTITVITDPEIVED